MFKNKLLPVLKASMTGEMNIFRMGKRKEKQSFLGKVGRIISLMLFASFLMFIFGTYVYMLAEPLHKVGLTHISITIFALVTTLILFLQGIYQAQGILFEARDSDMLFSMPIKKSTILASRLIKLLYFEYIWDLLVMLPTFAVYAFFENPDFTFYITALVIFLCLPIIPLIIVSIVGYIIQDLASRVKFKKAFQMIFTFAFMIIIFGFSFSIKNWIGNIAQYSQSLNDIVLKIYYPLGIYEQCILDFSILKLLFSLLGNLILFILYVLIFSISYFKIVSRLSEKHANSNYKLKEVQTHSKFKALLKKEIKRYFGSPIYVMNTIFGPVLLLISAIYLIVSKTGFESVLQDQAQGMMIDMNMLPKIVIILFMFTLAISTTTCSSISLEGKSFWLTKSLPVKTKEIFIAKIFLYLLISVPFAIITLVIYAIKLNMGYIDIIYCFLVSLIFPLLVGILGLIINLMFPLLNAKSDTVIVKQSISSLISIFAGMGLAFIPTVLYFILKPSNLTLYTGMGILIYTIITIILWKILNTYGVKKFNKLNN